MTAEESDLKSCWRRISCQGLSKTLSRPARRKDLTELERALFYMRCRSKSLLLRGLDGRNGRSSIVPKRANLSLRGLRRDFSRRGGSEGVGGVIGRILYSIR